jgi:glucose-6-phosphate 1-epimerase
VWNPWIAKSKRMPDFGDDEYPGMLCVETANAGTDARQLAPGDEHRLATTISVEAGP